MRIKLNIQFENNTINSDYKRKFLSYFKTILPNELIDDIYSENIMKSFTFSPILKIKTFNGDKITLASKEAQLLFSTNDIKDGIIFTNAFMSSKNKSYRFGDNSIKILDIKQIQEKTITENECIFKINSPIIIKKRLDNNKDWYYILDNEGIDVLKQNIKLQYKDTFSEIILDGIKITPVSIRKTVVKNYNIRFPVSLGTFKIEADKKLLDVFYKSGIGSKTSMGFGMLSI